MAMVSHLIAMRTFRYAGLSLFLLIVSPSFAIAYSFTFTSTPQQCANLSLSISGSGQPPYSVLIIPYGPTPLPNNIEARTIISQQFPDNGSSVTFQLKYPTNSQLVAVVSDNTGFGTGGTSVAATVLSSSDSSCYDASTNVSPDWDFNIYPPNQLVQCVPTRLWWDPSDTNGTVDFQGVIPGGESFSIPLGTETEVTDEGTGFSWTPPVRAGSTLMIVAGDGRGLGTGGSGLYDVADGTQPNSTCLTDDSPSSTPGNPAGGSYPTSSSGASTGGGDGSGSSSGSSGGSSTDVGAIVGGVVGGVAALIILTLLALFFLRRRRRFRSKPVRPVDLLQGDGEDDSRGRSDLPQYHQPVPFTIAGPNANTRDSGVAGMSSLGGGVSMRPESRYDLSEGRHSNSASYSDDHPSLHDTANGPPASGMGISSSARKSTKAIPQLRPVNIIQHDDAGSPSDSEENATETIELPPAYTNIRPSS